MQTQTVETISIIDWYVEEVEKELGGRPDKREKFIEALKENPETVQEEIKAHRKSSLASAFRSGKVKGFCSDVINPDQFAVNILRALQVRLLNN